MTGYSTDFPLSNVDINKFVKQADDKGLNFVVTKKEVTPTTDIEKIFKNRGHAVMHFGTQNGGHWVATLRDKRRNIYFMDSFGESPDHYDKDLLKCYKNNGIEKVYVNGHKLQNDNSETCGRYAILFTALNKKGIAPPDMIAFLKNKNGNKKESVDNFVIELTKSL